MKDSIDNYIHFYCLGISHHFANADIRKIFSLTSEQKNNLISNFSIEKFCFGIVIVSTCNRTEFFISSKNSDSEVFAQAEIIIAKFFNTDIHFIRRYFVYYFGKNAIRYLFRITSGLDSLFIGEYEILGQVRNAYKTSLELNKTDRILNIIFQRALRYAKIIRGASEFSNTALSYGTIVANEISKLNLEKPKVLLLGSTGQIGNLILRTLLNRPNFNITAVEHRYSLKLKHSRLNTISYEGRYDSLNDYDVIISATTSPHYTITFQEINKTILNNKPHLFIDLSIPNDIDPDIATIINCNLLDFSYFEKMINNHKKLRERGAAVANNKVDDFVNETCRKLCIQNIHSIKFKDFACLDMMSAKDLYYILQNVASTSELLVLKNLYSRGLEASRIGNI